MGDTTTDDVGIAEEFLPNLCTMQAIFALVLIGELLALVLAVADHSLNPFPWQSFATTSFLVQWIVMTSAACTCGLRSPLSKLPARIAVSLCYGLILVITGFFSVAAQWLVHGNHGHVLIDVWQVGSNLVIAAVFAGIALRYFYLQQQLTHHQNAELKARIQALQSRIRPHFLFNSMNSIASLIGSDPDKAEHVVEDLCDLFRASLSETTLVPVEQEIALCKQYMAIEQLRLGDRLQMQWQCDVLPAESKIPSLLLQPLLENAIYHGIQPDPKGGKVEFTAASEGNTLTISIVNPLPQANVQGGHKGNRMALENIRSRLKAHFGRRAGIDVETSDSLFTARIHIPC